MDACHRQGTATRFAGWTLLCERENFAQVGQRNPIAIYLCYIITACDLDSLLPSSRGAT
jgi:hypothetical protein